MKANLADYTKGKAEIELESAAVERARLDQKAEDPADGKPAHGAVEVATHTIPGAHDLTFGEAINAL